MKLVNDSSISITNYNSQFFYFFVIVNRNFGMMLVNKIGSQFVVKLLQIIIVFFVVVALVGREVATNDIAYVVNLWVFALSFLHTLDTFGFIRIYI